MSNKQEIILQKFGNQKLVQTDLEDMDDYKVIDIYAKLDDFELPFYFYDDGEKQLPQLPIKDISVIQEDCCGAVSTILTDANNNYFIIDGCPGPINKVGVKEILFLTRDRHQKVRAKYEQSK